MLEFVRGRPLSELIADTSKPLPLEKALDLGREIAEALEEAHKSGVVHRDIKPKNIMLIESGHIKVLDFGLAKALQPSADLTGAEPTTLTEPGQIMGTPDYMSPEQITGQTADPRSDIFSFGVVMFEMIAGVRPFSGATAAQVIGSIMTGDSEPLHRYRKGVPDALDRVIQRMLAKDPSERYQSVHEVWVELRHIREELVARSSRAARAISQDQAIGGAETVVRPIGGDVTLPPTATPAPSPVPTPAARPRWLGKPGRWALGLASVVGVAAVVVFVFWYQSSQPVLSFTARDWILVSDFENLTGDSIFDKSLATALNVSLSQSTYANVFSTARTTTVLQRMGKKPDTAVNAQVGREICQRENLRALICPSIGKVGNVFVVTAQIVDPQTGDGVRSYAEQAKDYNQILAALDRLAASVRKGLGESLAQLQVSSQTPGEGHHDVAPSARSTIQKPRCCGPRGSTSRRWISICKQRRRIPISRWRTRLWARPMRASCSEMIPKPRCTSKSH